MPIKSYNALIIDLNSGLPGTLTSIGVLRGANYPLIMGGTSYSKTAFEFSNSSDGTSISNGLFDFSMAFFGNAEGPKYSYKVDGSLFKAYNSDRMSIIFPGGCSAAITWYNSGYYMSYTSRNNTIRTGAWGRETMCGLISDSVYKYPIKYSDGTIGEEMALMQPLLYPFTRTIDGNTVYFARFCQLSSSVEYYPAKHYAINDTSSASNVTDFERQVSILSDFWNDVDANNASAYLAMLVCGAGGTVTPMNFWASANEPRMFTVTPDEHHAIHAITAYNTSTNTQIPLQESAMNLQTGAKSYMFTMPAANVRIIVEFRSIEITIPVTVSYTSPRGKVFTTSFNLLYDDTEQREETVAPVEEGE